MRILLASQAIPGHFNPMTGIGVRLKDEGHDVGWYTGRTLADRLDELGIPLYPDDRAVEHTGDNLNELSTRSYTRQLQAYGLHGRFRHQRGLRRSAAQPVPRGPARTAGLNKGKSDVNAREE
ncbi:MAG TPA: hypothetical protein VF885_20235 [Arthrobacter sp.]